MTAIQQAINVQRQAALTAPVGVTACTARAG
jgi:hypothetical protein